MYPESNKAKMKITYKVFKSRYVQLELPFDDVDQYNENVMNSEKQLVSLPPTSAQIEWAEEKIKEYESGSIPTRNPSDEGREEPKSRERIRDESPKSELVAKRSEAQVRLAVPGDSKRNRLIIEKKH